MRQILSQEEIDAKAKRRNVAISIFLLGIMVLSTVGFAFVYNDSDNNANFDSNGVQDIGGRWALNYGGQSLVFSNSPQSTNTTQMQAIVSLNEYSNRPLYIDSGSDLIYSEIAGNLGRYSERVQRACYGNCSESDWPEKNCSSDKLIVFRADENNKVSQQDNCVFINGDMRTVDAFLYTIFGVL